MNHFAKNHCLAILALALLLVLTAPVMAEEVRGTVAMIDPNNFTFTLVDNNNNILNMRFLVGGEVLLNDREATMWDLLPGDNVAVTFDRTGGELTVTAIECRRID